MKLTSEQQSFLAAVNEFNDQFNIVLMGSSQYVLCHSFWTKSEIEHALSVHEDWSIPKSLIPFYGDWHTLICLNPKDGTVQLLDDNRNVLHKWSTTEDFIRCLASQSEVPTRTSIIESESWLDF